MKADGSNAVQLLLLVGGISLSRRCCSRVTGFTRILIVLGFIRTGLGTPTAPPNQVLVGIALFLTHLRDGADLQRRSRRTRSTRCATSKITQATALKRAEKPMREFMFDQTRTKDLALFA